MKKTVFALMSSVSLISPVMMYADADVQANIAHLQQQVDALRAEISTPETVGLDSDAPFGLLSKVQMPLQLVKNKSTYTLPVTLGGEIEMDAQHWEGDALNTSAKGHYEKGSGLSLANTYWFTEANLGEHALGFVALKNSLPAENIGVQRAFIVLGKLTSSDPLFITAGNTYLPFGSFGGNGPLSNALTTNLFRISPTNQISATAVRGPLTWTAGFYNKSAAAERMGSVWNMLYSQNIEAITLNAGVGYLTDIAGTNSGVGNALTTTHSTPAFDINFNIGVPSLTFISEYATTANMASTQSQHANNFHAIMVGVQGKFKLLDTPYMWQLSNSRTEHMENVPMPLTGDYTDNLKTLTGFKNEWIGSVQGQYLKNVYMGPEISYGKLCNNQETYAFTLDLTAYF